MVITKEMIVDLTIKTFNIFNGVINPARLATRIEFVTNDMINEDDTNTVGACIYMVSDPYIVIYIDNCEKLFNINKGVWQSYLVFIVLHELCHLNQMITLEKYINDKEYHDFCELVNEAMTYRFARNYKEWISKMLNINFRPEIFLTRELYLALEHFKSEETSYYSSQKVIF